MEGMKDATVRHLQIFGAAVRASSFSGAGQPLHLTQPAVSVQMRQLERFAGLPLFERAGRRLHVTRAGEELPVHSSGGAAAPEAPRPGPAVARPILASASLMHWQKMPDRSYRPWARRR